MAEHDCNQGATLSTICLKIENIEKAISEVKRNQDTDLKEVRNTQRIFMEEIKSILIQNTKYPSCEDMGKSVV